MQTVAVRAAVDESRPGGRNTVITLQGVTSIASQTPIYLKPAEGNLDFGHDRGPAKCIFPIASRLHGDSCQLVLGADVAGIPHLIFGSAVRIEIPDAGLRGDFVWPDVVPTRMPRRRHMAAARRAAAQRVAVPLSCKPGCDVSPLLANPAGPHKLPSPDIHCAAASQVTNAHMNGMIEADMTLETTSQSREPVNWFDRELPRAHIVSGSFVKVPIAVLAVLTGFAAACAQLYVTSKSFQPSATTISQSK